MILKKTVWSTRNNPFPVKVKNQRFFSFRKSSLVSFFTSVYWAAAWSAAGAAAPAGASVVTY